MKEGVEHFKNELRQVRTGRASTALLDSVMVDYYGSPTPLNQLASLSVVDSTMLMAQPFDPSQIDAIERAIQVASLGLNPQNDGKVIRIPVPALTEERRKDLVKRAHEMAERSRNSVRGSRRDGNEQLKKLERDSEISKDDEKRGNDEMQKLHDHYISEVSSILAAKESEILEV